MDHILTLKCIQVKQHDIKKNKPKQHFDCCSLVKTI